MSKNETLDANPLVSIIITLYRHKGTLPAAIESVLHQTFQNFEIILVDNNASCDVLETAKAYHKLYPKNIRLVKESKQGIASARNRGVLEARGVYIAFCDEDDILLPYNLEKKCAAINENPFCSIITSKVDFISPEDGSVVESGQVFAPQFWAEEIFGKSEQFIKHPLYNPHPSTMFFRKDLALEVGLFDENFNPYWTEDTEFSLRMYQKGPIYLIDESLTQIRLASKQYLKDRQGEVDWTSLKNIDYFYKILRKKYGDTTAFPAKKALKKIRARWLRESSLLFLRYSNGKSFGRNFLIRSIKDEPWNPKSWKQYLRTFFPFKFYPRIFHFEKTFREPLPKYINKQYIENLFKD
ncbi:MAG: glycosyltransferase family A protein [Leptospirillum sp.]